MSLYIPLKGTILYGAPAQFSTATFTLVTQSPSQCPLIHTIDGMSTLPKTLHATEHPLLPPCFEFYRLQKKIGDVLFPVLLILCYISL